MNIEIATHFLMNDREKVDGILRVHPLTNIPLLAQVLVEFEAHCALLKSETYGLVLERCSENDLRDQFAMAALPALIQAFGKTPMTMKIAYEVADEMLEARKKPDLVQKGGENG